MEQLLKKINPDFNRLRRYVISNAAKELSATSEPCYYSKTKKIYFEFLQLLKLTDVEFKRFIKRNYLGTKGEKWVLTSDPGSNMFVFVMHLFLNRNDLTAYSTCMVYYMLFQYSKLMHKQIKYCDPETFKYTLDNLTKTHLFYREKTITNSLYYLSREVQKPYTTVIKNWDVDGIIAFIQASRHRISQSVKSFAEAYYRNKKQGIGIRTQREVNDDESSNTYQIQVQQRGQRIIDVVVKNINVYKIIDKKIVDEAQQLSKIKNQFTGLITNELKNEKYVNDIKIALQLFIKEISTTDQLCSNEFYTSVKKLMSLKRSVSIIYFKSQINNILMKVIKNLNLTNEYEKYSQQTKFTFNLFIAYYLTLSVRNNIC